MIEIKRATPMDAEKLTQVQTCTFQDDNQRKPPGCSMEGPPGYDSVGWNTRWIGRTPYYKILSGGQIVGGLIVFDLGQGRYELGRIYVDPACQNQGIGQQAIAWMFRAFPDAVQWTVGTPGWAKRNQHFYEKMGFVRVRETAVDPDLGWTGIEYEKPCAPRA
jgi:ribosomal protein S18 acetylase RimI-like enzyme